MGASFMAAVVVVLIVIVVLTLIRIISIRSFIGNAIAATAADDDPAAITSFYF